MTTPVRLVRLDGPGAGEQILVTRRLAVLGADPSVDHPLPSVRPAEVSPRHAALIQTETGWVLRDLQSFSGTWLNGIRISGDAPLHIGDEIRLGRDGLALRFADPPRPVSRALRSAALLAIVVVGGLIVAGLNGRGRAVERERQALARQVDSLALLLVTAQLRSDQLGTQLASALEQASTARQALTGRDPPGVSDRMDSLARVVRQLAEEQAPLVRAASLDLVALASGNQDAVALVLAERGSGAVVSGSGFAVHRAGDTSWVVTSRHVVVDSAGRPAERLGLVFNGTAQNFRATLAAVHPTADVALLRVVIRGGTPVVRGIGTPPRAGDPVGTITFPGELDLSTGAAWRRVGVAATSFSATVIAADTTHLQLEGYGVEGMSGSPVLSAEGIVVGVIFGGAAGTGGTIVLAVPSRRIEELLALR